MDNTQVFHPKEIRWSEAAVDGLFNGLLAGVLMGIFLLLAGWVGGESPAMLLSRFAPDASAPLLNGALIHLGVSGIYGLVFGLGFRLLIQKMYRVPTWLGTVSGLVYGLLLLAPAEFILIPEANSLLGDLPLSLFALAHVVYGLALGWLTGRTMHAFA